MQTCLALDWNTGMYFPHCSVCVSNRYDNDQLRCLLNGCAAKRNIKLKGQAGLYRNKSLSSTKKITSLFDFPLISNKFIEWQLYEKKSIHEDKAKLEMETSVILRTGELNSNIHLTLLAHKDTVHLGLFFFNKGISRFGNLC